MQMINKTRSSFVRERIHSPTISVIMAAYNAENTIQTSIRSVLAQTYIHWELIVVDDCSEDGTLGLVEALAEGDSRIHVYANIQNAGVAMTRNFAMTQARGKWVAFLDSDDMWREDKLQKQLRFAEETGEPITYTSTMYMKECGGMSGYTLNAESKLRYKDLLRKNLMSCSSVMVLKEEMIPFPLTDDTHEDYAVWLQLVKEKGCARGLDEPLLVYRMSDESKSSRRVKSAKMTFNAYRYVGYGVFISTAYTLRYSVHSITKRIRIYLGKRASVLL